MLYLAIKALVSGVMVMAVSELALPALPMFLLLPRLLRHGLSFYPAPSVWP